MDPHRTDPHRTCSHRTVPAALAVARRVVVLRALGLGDLLVVVPALRALRRAAPGAELVLAAPAWLSALAPALGVRVWVDLDLRARVPPRATPPRALRGADVAVNLHGAGPESTTLLARASPGLLLAERGPPARAGTAPSAGTALPPPLSQRERWCRLLQGAGVPADAREVDLDLAALPRPDRASPWDRGRVTVVHPGSASAARRWPRERWVCVVRGLAAEGHRVILTGSDEEAAACAEVARAAGLPAAALHAGRTSLPALVHLVAGARLVVAVDTGVAHLATATGTPSVVLFGPVGPQEWGPPASRAQHVTLWGGQASDPAGTEPAPALLALDARQVLDAALAAGAGAGPPAHPDVGAGGGPAPA